MPIALVIRYGSTNRRPTRRCTCSPISRKPVCTASTTILSDGIRPGVVQIATGAWFDPLVAGQPGSLDKHGNPNRVTADIGASLLSQGCSAQTAAVEIVKWTEALPPVSAFEPPVLERG